MGELTQSMKQTLIPTRNCLRCNSLITKASNCSVKYWEENYKFCSTSCSKKGNKNRLGISHPAWNKGKPSPRGPDSPAWRGGKTSEAQILRSSLEYKLWREAVYVRDNYTCQICGIRGGDVQADHIKKFADFPELRLALDNGRTLCVPCHRKTDTYGSKRPKT